MGKIYNLSMWFLLLSKRLYKKAAFMVILLLIPILVVGYRIAAREDSGMQTIVLAQENPEDPLATEITSELRQDSQLILFVTADTPAQAETLVKTGKADCAWIFPENTEQAIQAYLESPGHNDGFVRVVVREQTVPIRISLEKLSGVLFKHCARFEYLRYMQENEPGFDELTQEDILEHFDAVNVSDQLFSFSYMDGGVQTEDQTGYLMSPVRGLLGVLIVLCGLATAMYYIQDEKNGLFSWVPEGKRSLVELGYQAVSLINIAAAVFLTLVLTGLNQDLGRELLVMALYIMCCAAFCQCVRTVLSSIRLVGTVLPLLAVLMIAVCPVFFDLAILRKYQFLLPPTYYINGVYNRKYVFYMIAYTMVCWGISWIARKIMRRNE